MDIIGPQQFLIVIVFLALLGTVWFVVRLNKGELRSRLSNGRRLEMTEVTTLGGADRAILMRVDDKEFLVLKTKNAAPVLHELGTCSAEGAQ